MYQIARLPGLRQTPRGAYSAPPDPRAGGEGNIPSPTTPPLSALRVSVFGPAGLASRNGKVESWQPCKLGIMTS